VWQCVTSRVLLRAQNCEYYALKSMDARDSEGKRRRGSLSESLSQRRASGRASEADLGRPTRAVDVERLTSTEIEVRCNALDWHVHALCARSCCHASATPTSSNCTR
jgi:hypothetical protein